MPSLVIYKFQIWRLVTGPFMHPQLLMLLFSIMSYIPTAMTMEKEEGTVKMATHFFAQSLVIQILFCVITLILSLVWSESFLQQMSIGLWPILFADIVV